MFIPNTPEKPQAATHTQISGILRLLAHVKSVLYSAVLYVKNSTYTSLLEVKICS